MKTILLLLLSTVYISAGDTPTVEVYQIRKFDMKTDLPQMPSTIIEIANPTEKTFFVNGNAIERPFFDTEAKRNGKWLLLPRFTCGTGSEMFPLRPGAKMLLTVDYPWDEATARFRFYFFTSDDNKTKKVLSVRSRPIERKELGDLTGTIGEINSDKKLEDPLTDEELNKSIDQPKGPRLPFAE